MFVLTVARGFVLLAPRGWTARDIVKAVSTANSWLATVVVRYWTEAGPTGMAPIHTVKIVTVNSSLIV